jgi:hypothetical protein
MAETPSRRVSPHHHGPYPRLRLYDRGRRAALQRGPRLRAAPPAAPRRAPRQAPGRQPSVPVSRSATPSSTKTSAPIPTCARSRRISPASSARGGELRQDHRRRHAHLLRDARRPQGQGRDRLLRRRRLQALRHLRLPHRPDGRDGGRRGHERGSERLRFPDGGAARPGPKGPERPWATWLGRH